MINHNYHKAKAFASCFFKMKEGNQSAMHKFLACRINHEDISPDTRVSPLSVIDLDVTPVRCCAPEML